MPLKAAHISKGFASTVLYEAFCDRLLNSIPFSDYIFKYCTHTTGNSDPIP